MDTLQEVVQNHRGTVEEGVKALGGELLEFSTELCGCKGHAVFKATAKFPNGDDEPRIVSKGFKARHGVMPDSIVNSDFGKKLDEYFANLPQELAAPEEDDLPPFVKELLGFFGGSVTVIAIELTPKGRRTDD